MILYRGQKKQLSGYRYYVFKDTQTMHYIYIGDKSS